MIISASRRSDIPAFYSKWFMNRVRDGRCTVPNPFNRNQVASISLVPGDVDAIVFWTRNPRPLMSNLEDLDQRGFRYFFQFTVLGYPRLLDRYGPRLGESIATFIELSNRVGVDRVIWRYDPIVLTSHTDISFHLENFERIAVALRGYTNRCVISMVDIYRKSRKRLRQLEERGASVISGNSLSGDQLESLMVGINSRGMKNGMIVSSCADRLDLESFGICPGKCIDDEYLNEIFNINAPSRKDPGQRETCACVVSKDIGMYDSCLFGCQYCYATNSVERARDNFMGHDPTSPSLLGRYEADQPLQKAIREGEIVWSQKKPRQK